MLPEQDGGAARHRPRTAPDQRRRARGRRTAVGTVPAPGVAGGGVHAPDQGAVDYRSTADPQAGPRSSRVAAPGTAAPGQPGVSRSCAPAQPAPPQPYGPPPGYGARAGPVPPQVRAAGAAPSGSAACPPRPRPRPGGGARSPRRRAGRSRRRPRSATEPTARTPDDRPLPSRRPRRTATGRPPARTPRRSRCGRPGWGSARLRVDEDPYRALHDVDARRHAAPRDRHRPARGRPAVQQPRHVRHPGAARRASSGCCSARSA